MKKEKKEKHFIKKPIYEGGIKAMRELIKAHLKYPSKALTNKIEGTVHVKYTIDYKGKVIDGKVISGLGHGCDEEAVRLVKLFKFKTEKNRKMRVKFDKKIQIHFRLPKAQKKNSLDLQYNYVSSHTDQSQLKKEKKKDNNSGYNYTISF